MNSLSNLPSDRKRKLDHKETLVLSKDGIHVYCVYNWQFILNSTISFGTEDGIHDLTYMKSALGTHSHW